MRLSMLQKLLIGFLVIALIAGCAGTMFYLSLNRVHQSFSNILDRHVMVKSYADNLKYYATAQNGNLNAYMLTKDTFYKSEFTRTNIQIDEMFTQMKGLLLEQEMLSQLEYTIKLNKQYKDKAEGLLALPKEQVESTIKDAKTGILPLGGIIVRFAQQISDRQDQLMIEERTVNEKTVNDIRRLVVIISSINFVLALVIGFLIWRMISRPIRLLSGAARSISTGDLTIPAVQVKQQDEIGQLAQSFNQMKLNLQQLVVEINSGAREVIVVSKEVSAGAEQTGDAAEQVTQIMINLSESAEQQVQSVERSLQAVYDIDSDIRRIDGSSQKAMEVAGNALDKVVEGDREICRVMRQMETIQTKMNKLEDIMSSMRTRSNEIEEINKVISTIATQTNLLSLNATIEAARAGEHGRGFSVVTTEIRKLSQQTNDSAGRVTELANAIQSETMYAVQSVEEMVIEVSKGIGASAAVSELFNGIKLEIDDTTARIRDVTESLDHLSKHSNSIVQSMEQISGISDSIASGTQSVSSYTEEQLAFLQENAAHASSLYTMAENLHRTVHQFKV
ncbi:methyl-accepting chemotaxis protein [Paenibacillus alginolyticus]|uniref:methyl-accepting chemotaxis protein n=1 Tax=Paenibacillus alginolyticus TaxID=59839 RepID=UPI00041AE9D8|nr:methyl-accepting chemotaxis protein [Paenibacillus alginolyticus]MCY9665800.1 methyl-accepting chemotaxis protein [Paenibacillus alginolyticus]